ncbi:MAG: glycoside hydrolase family 3 N-terminal domain-containing protein [Planctomycetota bacterium]
MTPDAELTALAARVIVPVLDLRQPAQRPAAWARARRLRELGVGGFILFGGEASDVTRGLAELRALAPAPLVIGADLERGLGQQVAGGSALPPLLALGAADDEALARETGAALAREALAVGIDWIYAPVLDLADEPRNPIVGTRALAACPQRVARLGAAFVAGLQSTGARACAKHFPGHGGTLLDSHEAHPRVDHSAETLRARDLAPFRAAIAAGVASVMSAHVAYPALAGDALPATRSAALLQTLLREELGFQGAVVSDALIMDGVRAGGLSELEATCAALEAGCDLLLYPTDPEAAVAAVAAWAAAEPARAARLREAAARAEALAAPRERLGAPLAPLAAESAALEARVDEAALTRVGPAAEALSARDAVALLVLDDDGVPTLGHALAHALAEAGLTLHLASLGPDSAPEAVARWRETAAGQARRVVAVGCQVRAWKGRPGLAPALGALLAELTAEGLSVVGLCGPAALAGAVPAGAELLLAYGDAPAAERAAARVLLGAAAPGRLPAPLQPSPGEPSPEGPPSRESGA